MKLSKYINYIVILVGCIMTIITEDISKIPVILILLLVIKSAQKDKWYNPFWLLTITIASYILYYQQWGGFFFGDLTVTTKILVTFCFFAIYIGFYICKNNKTKSVTIGATTPPFFLIFFIGLIPSVISYFLYGNILALEGDDLVEARTQKVNFFNQLAYFLPASIIVACKRDKTIEVVLAIIFSTIAALMTVSKTALVIESLFIIMGIAVYHPSFTQTYFFQTVNKFKLIWIPILTVVMFAYNNNKRNVTETNDMEYVERSGTVEIWGTDNIAQNFYLDYCYLCSPWSNLDYNIRFNKADHWGANTFAQFAKKIGATTKTNRKINPSFLNTHTFITDYYLDFGFIGAIIASFVLGFFIYYCYSAFGLSDDPMLISLYVLIMYATCMLYFSNHFNIGYILNYFITFGLTSLITRKF